MLSKNRTIINVITSGGQVALTGLVYFLLYRYLFKSLGVELLGVWSVVMATTSIANLVDFGLASSVVRFVALYSDDGGKHERVKKLVFTASLFLFSFFLILSLIFYPFAGYILKFVIKNQDFLNTAIAIIPFSIICLIVNTVSGVFASVLDGFQKNYLRNIIYSSSSVFLLVLTYILVPIYGLKGVVLAQISQSLLILLSTLIFVIVLLKYNPLRWQWSKTIFKEIFGYGLKFQGVSLAAMLNEPITKLLLAKFGGLQFTGFYEMAYRLIMQIRGVIINANQSLVPVLVKENKFKEENSSEVFQKKTYSIYKLSFICVAFISVLFLCLPVLLNNQIAEVWIGSRNEIFNNVLFLLAAGLYINLLSAPAYFASIANGNLMPPFISQLILGILNLLLGGLLGYFFNGYGVVLGWVISVVISSFYLSSTFNKKNNISFTFSDFNETSAFLLVNILLIGINSYYDLSWIFQAFSTVVIVITLLFLSNKIYKRIQNDKKQD